MLLSEFYPYVLPYVMGCPLPTVDHHVRLAAMEFCKRTSCWQKTLDAVSCNGTDNLIEMDQEAGQQIIKVKAVAVGGINWPLVDSIDGLDLVRSGSQQSFCFTQDNKMLQIHPLQVAGIAVQVDAVLSPSRTATTIDDVIGNDYVQDMAHGAVASIQRIPAQDFTDPNSAIAEQQQFNNRISTIAAKVSRGFIARKMRSHASYL
jgi:hypothetical protein